MPAARLSPAAALRARRGARCELSLRIPVPPSRTPQGRSLLLAPRGSQPSRRAKAARSREQGFPCRSPEGAAGGCRAKGTADAASSPALGASERSEGSAPGLSPGASAGDVLLCRIPSLHRNFGGETARTSD